MVPFCRVLLRLVLTMSLLPRFRGHNDVVAISDALIVLASAGDQCQGGGTITTEYLVEGDGALGDPPYVGDLVAQRTSVRSGQHDLGSDPDIPKSGERANAVAAGVDVCGEDCHPLSICWTRTVPIPADLLDGVRQLHLLGLCDAHGDDREIDAAACYLKSVRGCPG